MLSGEQSFTLIFRHDSWAIPMTGRLRVRVRQRAQGCSKEGGGTRLLDSSNIVMHSESETILWEKM